MGRLYDSEAMEEEEGDLDSMLIVRLSRGTCLVISMVRMLKGVLLAISRVVDN